MRLRTGRFPKTLKSSRPISSYLPQCWLLLLRQRSLTRSGMKQLSCTGSSLIFRFRPSPCPTHYGEHLATIPSADFCLITLPVTQQSAIGFHRVRSPLAMNSKEPRHLYTRASLVICRSPVKQISPDKSMHCHCTAASFTVAVRSRGFAVLCQLASSLRLI